MRSRRHEITTECITKIALSANDDKRHIIPKDPKHRTLALGHYTINGLQGQRPETHRPKEVFDGSACIQRSRGY